VLPAPAALEVEFSSNCTDGWTFPAQWYDKKASQSEADAVAVTAGSMSNGINARVTSTTAGSAYDHMASVAASSSENDHISVIVPLST
jgi:hypothetical protein